MRTIAEVHAKILAFLVGEFAHKEGRQCIGVDLLYVHGNGVRDVALRKWTRADQSELFEGTNVEQLVGQIIRIAEDEVEALGARRFVVRTWQYMGDRASCLFTLASSYNGSDAMVVQSTSTSLAELVALQNSALLAELIETRVENRSLRRSLDEARARNVVNPSLKRPSRKLSVISKPSKQSRRRRRAATVDR